MALASLEYVLSTATQFRLLSLVQNTPSCGLIWYNWRLREPSAEAVGPMHTESMRPLACRNSENISAEAGGLLHVESLCLLHVETQRPHTLERGLTQSLSRDLRLIYMFREARHDP
jgi:hypothetical protein